jgi:hypothetical protein
LAEVCKDNLVRKPISAQQKYKHIPPNDQISSLEMNDNNMFVLLKSCQKLKIFETQTFTLVREIDTNANWLKLILTESIFLFDSTSRVVYWYDQHSFEKLNEENISEQLPETNLMINSDKTKHITFYNSKAMKSILFSNHI